jgi:hypothetical protein
MRSVPRGTAGVRRPAVSRRQVVKAVVFSCRAAQRPFPAKAGLLRDPGESRVVGVHRQPGPLDPALRKHPAGHRAERLGRVPVTLGITADPLADLGRATPPVCVEHADRADHPAASPVEHHEVQRIATSPHVPLAGEPICQLITIRRDAGRERSAPPAATSLARPMSSAPNSRRSSRFEQRAGDGNESMPRRYIPPPLSLAREASRCARPGGGPAGRTGPGQEPAGQ